jgi:hypothetical protein
MVEEGIADFIAMVGSEWYALEGGTDGRPVPRRYGLAELLASLPCA